MTYQQEQAAKLKVSLPRLPRYRFERNGYDRFHGYDYTPADGTIVHKTQPHSAPKNGTFGQCYIMDTDGQFIGLVDESSLTRVPR